MQIDAKNVKSTKSTEIRNSPTSAMSTKKQNRVKMQKKIQKE